MTSRKLAALSFDDGPSNITSKVLDILEENHVRASFFLIGNLITEDKRDILEREVSLGCEICNHSLTHSDMTQFDSSVIKYEIEETSRLIESYTGQSPKFFRPPYILTNDTMYENINLPFICGADSRDWDPNSTTEDRINNVMSQAKDGVIYLMHDLENNDKTVEALPTIINNLREDGFEFVTISEIFELKEIDPNVPNALWSFVLEPQS